MAPFSNKTILWVVTGMNILNFIDRGIVPGATNEFIQFIEKSHIHHNEDLYLGLLQSAFIIGYAISSGIFGHMVHFYPPFKICLVGMTIWVVAVLMSGFSYYTNSYVCLFIARMLSGVAESSFQCSLPPWIAKYATAEERGTWMSIFYTAIPVGTAVGYAYSAALAESIGWQYAFFIEAFVMLLFFPFLLAVSPYFPSESHHHANESLGHDRQSRINDLSSPSPAKPPTFWEEFKALWSSPVYFLVVAGYAMQTGAVIGVSTFGSAFLMGLGYFDTETQASTTFGALVSAAGIISTPLGGVFLDRLAASRMPKEIEKPEDKVVLNASSKIRQEQRNIASLNSTHGDDSTVVHAVHDPVKEQATLRAALMLITLCQCGGALFMCLDYFVFNKVLFVMIIGVGCCFIFLTYSGISIAMMLSVPTRHRAFAMGISTLCIHVFGDVPSPIIAGYIKDTLAPGCAGGSDTSGADSVATSDACRKDNAGLRLTMLILCLLLIVSVVFFALGWLTNITNKKKEYEEDSQRIHLLQQDVFDESLDQDEEFAGKLTGHSHDASVNVTSSRGQVANLRRPNSITAFSSGSGTPLRSQSMENAIALPQSPVRIGNDIESHVAIEQPPQETSSFLFHPTTSAPLHQVHVVSLGENSQTVALAAELEAEAEEQEAIDLGISDSSSAVYNPVATVDHDDVVEVTKRKGKKKLRK